jgi:parvulin-like peptidyl-prolyl isomerase/tetratricopeptide (TPR) repeat protein
MPRRTTKLWVNVTLWMVIVGFVIGGILFFTPGGQQIFNTTPAPPEEPALIVNGEKILPSELNYTLQSIILQYRQLYQQVNSNFDEQLQGAGGAYYQLQLRSQAADSLIRNELLKQEIRKRRVSIPQTQIDLKFRERYEQFLQTNQVTEQQLVELLRDPRTQQLFRDYFNLRVGTLSEFKSKLRAEAEFELQQERLKDLVIGDLRPTDLELLSFVEKNQQRYLTQIVGPIVPSDEQLQEYFTEHEELYAQEEIRASHILLHLHADAAEAEVQAARRKLEDVQRQLARGADFARLAQQFSEDELTKAAGGDLGYFVKGASPYDEDFEDAAFALGVGKVSDIVRTDEGLHLIKVTERRTKAFAEVKEQVKKDFIDERQGQLFAAWLASARQSGVFPALAEVRARHILIRAASTASEEEIEAARQKIEELQKQLEEGADFAKLAQEHSEDPGSQAQGGDLGWFGHGWMVAEFDQAAFALQENQISEPVRTPFGFHLIQLLERRMSNEFKTQILSAYGDEQQQQRFEDWVKQVTDAATIEVKEPLLVAYRLEERAKDLPDPDAKLQLLDEALSAYERTGQTLISDPYLGYYQSQLYQQKLSLLEETESELGEEATEEERQALQMQIERTRKAVIESFLRSEREQRTYGARDAGIFQQMVELDPQNAELRYYYARFLVEQEGKDLEAYDELKKAVEANPSYWQAQLLAADIQMRRGVYASVIEHLETALESVPTSTSAQRDVRLKLAQAHLQQANQADREENLSEAEAILTQLVSEYSDTEQSQRRVEAFTLLGDVYQEQGKYRPAQEAYREGLKTSSRVDVEIKLARAYFADQQLDQAERTFQSVAARDAYNVDARMGLAEIYRARGQLEKALENYRHALDLRADSKTKRTLALQILALDPADTRTRERLAQLYLSENSYDRAIEQYQLMLENDPQSWRAQSGLGEAYLGKLSYEQAKDHFKSAILLGAPSDQQVLLYQKILEAEQRLVGTGNPVGPDGQEAMLELADRYLKQGNADRAKEQLRKLVSDYPDYESIRVTELLAEAEGKGLPGDAVVDLGREHTPSCQPGNYNSLPPTSGCHSGNTVPWGVHAQPIPDVIQIHNLEHGGVLVQYEPNVEPSLVEQLTSYVTRLREQAKYCKLIVAPYPNLDAPIALTAWTRIMKLDSFDENKMTGFIDTWIEKGPEKGIPCS